MLKERILTALVLLALFVPSVLLSDPWPFTLLSLLFVSLAVWEWARLQGLAFAPSAWLGLGFAAGGFAGTMANGVTAAAQVSWAAWFMVCVVWVVLMGITLSKGAQAWAQWPAATRIPLGVALLASSWVSVLLLREAGLATLISVLLTIWASDIAAYFGGRRFGRRKLAPSVSPGKSWEGVWSGGLAATVVAIGLAVSDVAFYGGLFAAFGVAAVVAVCLSLVALGVCGDLFESLVKRSAGAKDSSALLPGHGGVLDRLDALLPTLPFAALVVSVGHLV